MKELNKPQLEEILRIVVECEAQHPKAKVGYDPEKERVNITYPLPKDFWTISKIKIRGGQVKTEDLF